MNKKVKPVTGNMKKKKNLGANPIKKAMTTARNATPEQLAAAKRMAQAEVKRRKHASTRRTQSYAKSKTRSY
jgi:hypothetical protein